MTRKEKRRLAGVVTLAVVVAMLVGVGMPMVLAMNGSSGGGSVASSPVMPQAQLDIPAEMMDAPECDFSHMLGMDVNEVAETIRQQRRTIRVLTPGQPATMDYSPRRVNIIYDEDSRTVTDITCG